MLVSGPTQYPTEGGSPLSQAPITAEGPAPFYPPMCISSHWDAGAILRKTLPTEYVAQALDPRPWAKICMEYTTTGEDGPAPPVSASVVMPSGGQFYPISRYMASIDDESLLRGLDRPLGTCEKKEFLPNPRGDMYNSGLLVPKSTRTTPREIEEVSFSKVLINGGPYDCRNDNDKLNIRLSDNLFNNATKQDRYKLKGKV
jgi:hypothetical protein